LQGDQYAGKTSWFWSLTNKNRQFAREGASLNPADRDSVSQCLEFWLVELGELGSTFRKADISLLKAFITKDSDILRRPYARAESRYPRRTVFLATVNEDAFLADSTGNRRFWCITCGKNLNPHHGIDMQQVYAQAAVLRDRGEPHLLTREENALLSANNAAHESVDPISEFIMASFDWDKPEHLQGIRYMSASQVLIEIGYERPNQKQKNVCADTLKKMGCDVHNKSGLKYYGVPAKKVYSAE